MKWDDSDALLGNQGRCKRVNKSDRTGIQFSRSVGKDMPATATLLVVVRECMPGAHDCQYVREHWP